MIAGRAAVGRERSKYLIATPAFRITSSPRRSNPSQKSASLSVHPQQSLRINIPVIGIRPKSFLLSAGITPKRHETATSHELRLSFL